MARRRATVTIGLLLACLVAPAPASGVRAGADERPAVVEARTIGHSVKGRPIRAWRLGEPGKRRIVLVSTMHGDEPHTRAILESLRDGRAIRGVDLWVVPTYNLLHAQVGYRLPRWHSEVRVGAQNLLNFYHIEVPGGPRIGGIYYVQYTFDPFSL